MVTETVITSRAGEGNTVTASASDLINLFEQYTPNFAPVFVPRNYRATLHWSEILVWLDATITSNRNVTMYLVQGALPQGAITGGIAISLEVLKPLLTAGIVQNIAGTPTNTVLKTVHARSSRDFDTSRRNTSITSKGAGSNQQLGWQCWLSLKNTNSIIDAIWNAEFSFEWLGGHGDTNRNFPGFNEEENQ